MPLIRSVFRSLRMICSGMFRFRVIASPFRPVLTLRQAKTVPIGHLERGTAFCFRQRFTWYTYPSSSSADARADGVVLNRAVIIRSAGDTCS